MKTQDAILHGGGDFADLGVHCPVMACPWEHWWETDLADVTLGDG